VRPIVKRIRTTGTGSPLEVDPWGDAKPDLCDDLGTFCCYCEKYNSRSALHVEHIRGKKCTDATGAYIYDHLKFRWDNFLIGCVNCNGVKDNKDVGVLNPYMPHENNLVHFIEILQGGIISIKPTVAGVDLTRTQEFINLVGLDRDPTHADFSDKDDRWDNRLKVYDFAERQFNKYTQPLPTTDIENIVTLAKTTGYFSIWYYRFVGHNEVIDALINGFTVSGSLIQAFPSTHVDSFDADNNFSTLPRP
jgi:hypothetical protein